MHNQRNKYILRAYYSIICILKVDFKAWNGNLTLRKKRLADLVEFEMRSLMQPIKKIAEIEALDEKSLNLLSLVCMTQRSNNKF
jgi:hypothetical protein